MSAESNLKALQAIAAQIPDLEPSFELDLSWERDGLRLGVSVFDGTITVDFANAQREVASFAEAAELVRAIMNDKIAAVTGYCDGEPVYFDLAPPNDPAAGINRLDKGTASVNVPRIDAFSAILWSGEELG